MSVTILVVEFRSDWAYPLWTRGTAIYTSIVLIGLLDVEKLTPGLGVDLAMRQSRADVWSSNPLTSHILLLMIGLKKSEFGAEGDVFWPRVSTLCSMTMGK